MTKKSAVKQEDQPAIPIDKLYQEVRQLIESAKGHVVTQVNQALVLMYWHIGKTIKTEVLGDERGEYGAAIFKQLAKRLIQDYGNGFSYSSLTRMVKFYSFFLDREIVVTLSQQLSWSHIIEIIKFDDIIKREFYAKMTADGRWSVRTL